MRKSIVTEVIGGILCRDLKYRESYKEERLLELRAWLMRIQGILTTLRHRPYMTDDVIASFIDPIENIFNTEQWETEVFSVIENEFESVKHFVPSPTDFSSIPPEIPAEYPIVEIDDTTKQEVLKEWNKIRINAASDTLFKVTGVSGEFVGIGNEGVSLVHGETLYKVFESRADDVSVAALEKFGASIIEHDGPTLISRRRFHHGKLYRGGHGRGMVDMLKALRSLKVYHKNISPDNIVVHNGNLNIIDLGRDLRLEEDQSVYHEQFKDMCKRAFLCFRYGRLGNNSFTLQKLKIILRDPSSLQLVGFEDFMAIVMDEPQTNPELELLGNLNKLNIVCCGTVTSTNSPKLLPFKAIVLDTDDEVAKGQIEAVIMAQLKTESQSFALVLEHPYDVSSSPRQPIWYKRHLHRLLRNGAYSLEEKSIVAIDRDDFRPYTKYHCFVLARDPGCYLLIKSCPMEHRVILSNVRRIVHSLEQAMSFKAILLVADISKTDNFIRQYESSDMESYTKALRQIEEERLVDQLIIFDGKDLSVVKKLNEQWFGRSTNATHSLEGQHYASTFYALQVLKDDHDYVQDDLVLQLDSDIIVHCEGYVDGLAECAAEFRKEPNLVTFAFPILAATGGLCIRQYASEDGTPPRIEIRCSFLNVSRLYGKKLLSSSSGIIFAYCVLIKPTFPRLALLPLDVPANESAEDGFFLRRGWWHTLDHTIEKRGMKSVRGSLAGNRWFFIHPQNDLKSTQDLHLVSDVLSNNLFSISDLEQTAAWERQLGKVDLESTKSDWLPQRNEPVVVVFLLHDTPEKDGKISSFKSW